MGFGPGFCAKARGMQKEKLYIQYGLAILASFSLAGRVKGKGVEGKTLKTKRTKEKKKTKTGGQGG